MDSIFHFLRSDLFLSLLGGFTLGVAGLTFIQPANANDVVDVTAHSLIVVTS